MRIEISTWILCGSHANFKFSLSSVFESKSDSNLDSIFLWVPVYYRFWTHLLLFSHFLSLSLSPLVLLKNNYLRTKRISKKQKEEKPEVSYCRKKNRSIICNFSHTSIHLSRFILNSSRIISSRHRFSGRCCPKMYYFPRVSSEVKVLLMWLAGFSGHFDCCQILL